MRLYLSSFRVGDHPGRLIALARSGRTLALVTNALDGMGDAVRRAGIARDVAELCSLGFSVTELDLHNQSSVDQLASAEVVWVRGGNVFVLRRAMAETGADAVLVDLMERDQIVYAGYSAGACVLAPDLTGLDGIDDATVVPDPIYRGLAVLDRPLVPHVRSPGHPETADCDAVSKSFTAKGVKHWALRDGDVLLIDGATTEVLPRLHR